MTQILDCLDAAPVRATPSLLSIRELRCLAHNLAASWHTSAQIVQSRQWHRVAYRRPVLLTPLDGHPEAPAQAVHGRDISLGGFSFAHDWPLACRRAEVAFPLEDGGTLTREIRLTWCRFTREGNYHSGGLFVDANTTAAEGW